MTEDWTEPWEVIPINRKFLFEKGFSEGDRKETLSDEEFLDLLSSRVRCLDPNCDCYFYFRPLSSDMGECWNCGRKYVVPEEPHRQEVEDHGPMVVPVLDPNDEEMYVRIVGTDGEGWGFVDYMEWIGVDWEDFYEHYLDMP